MRSSHSRTAWSRSPSFLSVSEITEVISSRCRRKSAVVRACSPLAFLRASKSAEVRVCWASGCIVEEDLEEPLLYTIGKVSQKARHEVQMGGWNSREIFEVTVSRISIVASTLASRAGEAAWVGNLAPETDNAAGEGLALKVFRAGEIEDDEEDAENILREARTRAGREVVAMRHEGPGAEKPLLERTVAEELEHELG